MLDISETLEAELHMVVYADDIILYAIDPNKDCNRLKIKDFLVRISACVKQMNYSLSILSSMTSTSSVVVTLANPLNYKE